MKMLNRKSIILAPALLALSMSAVAGTQFSINEKKSVDDVWLHITNTPYVRAKANYFTVSGEPINSKLCGLGIYEGFCSEHDYVSAMEKVCAPLFDTVTNEFGSAKYAKGDYAPLDKIALDYRNAFIMYDHYLTAKIKNATNAAKIDGISKRERNERYEYVRKLQSMQTAARKEFSLAKKSLTQSIWRSANAYDQMNNGINQMREKIRSINNQSFSGPTSEMSSNINGGITSGLVKSLDQIYQEKAANHQEDPSTISNGIQYAQDKGTVKILSYPSCAVQLYNGKMYNPKDGQFNHTPACLADLNSLNNMKANWESTCDSFISNTENDPDVANWLQTITQNNNNAPKVVRQIDVPDFGTNKEKLNERDRISQLYGSAIANEVF